MTVLFATAVCAEFLNVAHWNPHWECFAKEPTCKSNATAALTELLASGCSPTGCAADGLDFASVIEFEVGDYKPPAGWAAIGASQTCGHDWATLFYNAEKWRIGDWSYAGCLTAGRAFAAATFSSSKVRSGATGRAPPSALVVVAAHFPQTQHNASAYGEATQKLKSVLASHAHTHDRAQVGTTANTILMADTNTESPTGAAKHPYHNSTGGVNKTNAELMADIGLWPYGPKEPPAAPLFDGCCCTPFGPWDTPFSWQGDRIVATFGTPAASRHLFDPAPEWACNDELRNTTGAEFHKGVHLTLEI